MRFFFYTIGDAGVGFHRFGPHKFLDGSPTAKRTESNETSALVSFLSYAIVKIDIFDRLIKIVFEIRCRFLRFFQHEIKRVIYRLGPNYLGVKAGTSSNRVV